jgi:hypothetical protein
MYRYRQERACGSRTVVLHLVLASLLEHFWMTHIRSDWHQLHCLQDHSTSPAGFLFMEPFKSIVYAAAVNGVAPGGLRTTYCQPQLDAWESSDSKHPLIILIFFSVTLQSLKDLGRLTYRRFLWAIWTYGRTSWTSDQPVARPLPTQDNTKERRGQTPMPLAGFEPTIPATNRPRPTHQTARPLWPASTVVINKCDDGYFHPPLYFEPREPDHIMNSAYQKEEVWQEDVCVSIRTECIVRGQDRAWGGGMWRQSHPVRTCL